MSRDSWRWYTSRLTAVICVFVCLASVFHAWKQYAAFYNQEVARSAKARHYWATICENGARMVHDDFVDCDGVRRRKDANVHLHAADLTFQHLIQDFNPFNIEWCSRGTKCDFFVSWVVTSVLSNLYTFVMLLGVIIIAIIYAFVHYTRLKTQQVELMREYQQRQTTLFGPTPQHHAPLYQPLLSPQPRQHTPTIQYVPPTYAHNNRGHSSHSTSSMNSRMQSTHLTVIPELDSDDDEVGGPMFTAYNTYTNMRSRGSPQ